MTGKGKTTEFLKMIIEAVVAEEKEDSLFQVIDEFYGLNASSTGNRHVESEIAQFVLADMSEKNEDEFDVSYIKEGLTSYVNKNKGDLSRKTIISSVRHLIECIDYIEPIASIKNEAVRLNRETKQMFQKLKEMETTSKSLKSELYKAKEESKQANKAIKRSVNNLEKTQVNFVSILGIFSSITFGLFGGLSMLASVFEQSRDLAKKHNIILMVVAGLFILLCMIILVSYLLSAVARIIGREDVLPKTKVFTGSWERMVGTKWLVVFLVILIGGLSTIYFCITP